MGASHGNCGTGTTKEGSPHNGPTALTHPEVAVWYRLYQRTFFLTNSKWLTPSAARESRPINQHRIARQPFWLRGCLFLIRFSSRQ